MYSDCRADVLRNNFSQLKARCDALASSSSAHIEAGRLVLQCVAVFCSVLQCFAVCCSALQCVAVYCSVLLQLHCVAVSCSVLQCLAVSCTV